MAEEENKFDWVKIIMGVVVAFLAVFGVAMFMKADKEEAARVEAQNKIAEMSEVIQENENTWSRLSQQQTDLIDRLREQNEEMANTIEARDESIVTLGNLILNFKPIRVIVQPGNVNQAPDDTDPERTRVSFNQDVDPIRVSGFTLTDPPEAEVEVAFTRPLRLTTTVTQSEDGSWRTYVEGDYPNLEIEHIETFVNPLPLRERTWVENIIIGGNADLSILPNTNAAGVNLFLLYDFEAFAFGPSVGFGLVGDEANLNVGLQIQAYPWR